MITVVFGKGNISDVMEFNVTGFQTQEETDVQAVKALFTDKVTTKTTTLPTEILLMANGTTAVGSTKITDDQLGITAPTGLPTDVTYDYTVLALGDSNLKITATIYKGSATDITSFYVTGYKTRDIYADVAFAKALFTDKVTTKTTTLASSIGNIGQSVNNDLLGISEPNWLSSSHISYTYKIKSIFDGSLVITARIYRSDGSQTIQDTIDFKVTGYQIKADD